jgi:hypothetical protein
MNKFGRNDPCPCGSGKKYKKCCLGKTGVYPEKITKDLELEYVIESVELSNNGKINNDLETVIRSAARQFFKLCPTRPPSGMRPIRIFYNSKEPIVYCTPDIGIYRIGLTVSTRNYAQAVFQLGHELCHIVVDARRSNWFIESCCEMMSHMLLYKMSDAWASKPPYANWRSYAAKFSKYSQKHIIKTNKALFQNEKIPGQDMIDSWLVRIKDSLREDACDRKRNTVIAQMLHLIFNEYSEFLEALQYLGRATDKPPVDMSDVNVNAGFNCKKWIEAVPSELKKVARRVEVVFKEVLNSSCDGSRICRV